MASSRQRSRASSNANELVYHIVSHTHWDREWYKPFEQFRARLVDCIDNVLDLLNAGEAYKYFMLDGQTCMLEDYLEIMPERERDLKMVVRNGRLNIGPWYNLPDEFLVSAEAMIRNLLRGKALCKRFGGRMNAGYIPDSFGHIAAMPTLFAGFGIGNAVLYRGFGGESGEETSEYKWRAPDGTCAVMHHLHPDGYSGGYFAQDSPSQALARFLRLKKILDRRALSRHRLILSGGDHHFPDPALARTITYLRKQTGADIRQSTLEDFLQGVAAERLDLPEVRGELHFGFRYAFAVSSGVYSSRMYLKQQNWLTQRLYERYTEPLNALCVASGKPSHRALVTQGWKYLLQNHPHDSICGCSVDVVHGEMETRFAKARQIGAYVVETCLETLVSQNGDASGDASGDDKTICVFNPSIVERNEAVRATVDFYLQDIVVGLNPNVKTAPRRRAPKGLKLIDESGKQARLQILECKDEYGIAYSNYNYPAQTRVERFDVLIDAPRQSALSMTKFSVSPSNAVPRFNSRLKTGNNGMENDFVRVTIRRNGAVTILDKTTGNRFTNLNLFEDGGDAGDEYNYSYPAKDTIISSATARAKTTLLERGPLRAAIRASCVLEVPLETKRAGRSNTRTPVTVVSTIFLYENSPIVEFETTVTNTARDHRLRALFETGIETNISVADEHFALIERERRSFAPAEFPIEVPASVQPMQRFVTIQDGRRALSVFSYGLPEYELKLDAQRTLALTLLRCVGRLSGGDLLTRPGGDAGWKNATPGAQCLGEHKLCYAVLAHPPGDWKNVLQAAEIFHTPRLAFSRKHAMGKWKNNGRTFSIDNETIVFSSLKETEDGNGVVLRLYNPLDKSTTSILAAGNRLRSLFTARLDETLGEELRTAGGNVTLEFAPFEVKTIVARF